MSPRRITIAVLLLAGLCAVGLRAQEQFTLLATILDPEKGTPVESLTVADVRVTEDGEAAKVTKVEAVVKQVKALLLIDNGVGIGTNTSEFRSGVRKLIEALPPDVETTIYTTAPAARLFAKATKNKDDLLKSVDRMVLDTATGRFTESLAESLTRLAKEKDTFTVIICVGTTSGESQTREQHMKEVIEGVRGKPVIVHVLMYGGERSATGGDVQIEIGQRVAKMSGGRYEFINSMNRFVTLMPELGAEVAKQMTGSTRQFRITAQRPAGKKGDFGKLGMSAGARAVTSVKLE
jgi:hypothetical protein